MVTILLGVLLNAGPRPSGPAAHGPRPADHLTARGPAAHLTARGPRPTDFWSVVY